MRGCANEKIQSTHLLIRTSAYYHRDVITIQPIESNQKAV